MLKFLNITVYILFQVLRCLKYLSLTPLMELTFDFNEKGGKNLNRISSPLNGYQYFITHKFEANLKRHYPEHCDQQLNDQLFPDKGRHYIAEVNSNKITFHDNLINHRQLENVKINISKYE